MNYDRQRQEVDANYDYFVRNLARILPDHFGQYALMSSSKFVGFFDTVAAAYRSGVERYGAEPFSIQEVTDEPIDLGFYSHVPS